MMIEDIEIPEATRENAEIAVSPKSPLPLLISGGVVVGAIALGAMFFFNRSTPSVSEQPVSEQPEVTEAAPAKTKPEANVTDTSATLPNPPKPEEETVDNILGHLPYEEATASDLVAVTSDGRIRLKPAAAQKYLQMEADARAQGIQLAALSGFRSVEAQNYLFFNIKEQRVQGAAKRAEVSAPPGHSEHHTGYVIDIGDANATATHLETDFETTAAFKWLQKNAARYSFELSFPRDNVQGISYEPWHWRFVGDRSSLETFYKAKNLKK